MKNQEMRDLLLTILFLVFLVAVCSFAYVRKNTSVTENINKPVKSKVHFSLEDPDKSLQMIIKNLEEEYNIIVPIEDVEKIVITNLSSDKEKVE
jgi:hypothetical protein